MAFAKAQPTAKYVQQTNTPSRGNVSAVKKMALSIPTFKDKYRIHWSVGSGHYGPVLLLSEKYSNKTQFLTLKVLGKPSSITSENEIIALRKLQGSKNIVQLVEEFRTDQFVAIITNFVANDNFSQVHRKFSPEDVQLYMKNLLIALRSVHSIGVTHGDVKPTNFLFDMEKKKFVLIDFGMVLPLGQPVVNKGTRGYVPPECIMKAGYSTEGIDIFAAGIIFMTLLSGIYPFFHGRNLEALQEFCVVFGYEPVVSLAQKLNKLDIINSLEDYKSKKPLGLRRLAKLFRQYETLHECNFFTVKCQNCQQLKIFCVCAEKRKTKNGLRNILDLFPESTYDLVERMLKLDPERRISASEALKHEFFRERLPTFPFCEQNKSYFKNGIAAALFSP